MQKDSPLLEECFLEPGGWRWDFFERDGRSIRTGYLPAENARATIVCLTGLSEYAEKYFETARTITDMGYDFWIMDWMGQGRSGRYLKNPHKRHSLGFEHDIEDLHRFISNSVKPNGPLVLLAHSMGGNIGLRYLHRHPDIFSAAAFSAPLCAIKAVSLVPQPLALMLTASLNMWAPERYVGDDGDWREDMREIKGHDPFSSDPVRKKIHNAWCMADPRLQVGRVTYGWVYHALRSCIALQQELREKPLATPTLFALAGDEAFVDNKVTRALVGYSKTTHILELPESRHEIFMETDSVRSRFFEALQNLIDKNNGKS